MKVKRSKDVRYETWRWIWSEAVAAVRLGAGAGAHGAGQEGRDPCCSGPRPTALCLSPSLSHSLTPPLAHSGGGAALLHASKGLDEVKAKLDNFDQKIGVTIIQVGQSNVTRCCLLIRER